MLYRNAGRACGLHLSFTLATLLLASCGGADSPEQPSSSSLAAGNGVEGKGTVSIEASTVGRVVYQRSQMLHDGLPVRTVGVNGSRLYALSAAGRLIASDTFGQTWVDTGSKLDASNPPRGLVFTGKQVYAYTRYGRILRSPLGDALDWTDVSVPSNAPPYLPPGTNWRPDVLTATSTHLFYGSYHDSNTHGAHVYRSADGGAHWQEVLTVPEPLARHVHSVRADPRNPHGVFATIGDMRDGATGVGLYYSAADGAPGTFKQISSNLVGTDLIFPNSGDRFFVEADGPVGHYPSILSRRWSDLGKNMALDVQIPRVESWGGTTLAATMTANEDLVWANTTENGVHGSKEGVWFAAGPNYNAPRLLEDITAKRDEWPVLDRTLAIGIYLFNGSNRIYVSPVQSTCTLSSKVLKGLVRASNCIQAPAATSATRL